LQSFFSPFSSQREKRFHSITGPREITSHFSLHKTPFFAVVSAAAAVNTMNDNNNGNHNKKYFVVVAQHRISRGLDEK